MPFSNQTLALFTRHWNTIAGTLFSKDVYFPVLEEDENGVARGNDWATGFLRGVGLRSASWAELIEDEEHGGAILPMFALAHEHDPDPEKRPAPISEDGREKLLQAMIAGLVHVYRYFEPHRHAGARDHAQPRTVRRGGPKVGRNDPCSCGSGKKYKHCCGSGQGPVLH